MTDILYVGNSNSLSVTNLKDNDTGDLISDAVVTVTLKDSEGANVGGSGVSWPVTLAAVGGTPGAYRGVLPITLDIAGGQVYVADLTVTKDGATGFWRKRFKAKVRE